MSPRWMTRLSLAGLLVLSLPAAAETETLTREMLSRCASQVQTLRDESSRLNTSNALLDERRKGIEARSAQLKEEGQSPAAKELKTGLNLTSQRLEHNIKTREFNAEIEKLREEITALNALKFDYDQRCARRPYRRSDLESLPADAQEAMRTGLGDVRVPYIEGATSQ